MLKVFPISCVNYNNNNNNVRSFKGRQGKWVT